MTAGGNPLHRWAVSILTLWAVLVAALGVAEWVASGAMTAPKLAVLLAMALAPVGLYGFIRWLAGKG